MTHNIGSAILIIGVLYLYQIYHINYYVSIFLIVVGLSTWSYYAWSSDRHKLLKAQIDLTQAKSEYYRRRNN